MEKITLEQIAFIVAFMVSLITGVSYLNKQTQKLIKGTLKGELLEINKKIDILSDKIDNVDMSSCKNFLVVEIAEIERGNILNETERERFYEQYEHYIKIGGNSYIKRKVEELKENNML